MLWLAVRWRHIGYNNDYVTITNMLWLAVRWWLGPRFYTHVWTHCHAHGYEHGYVTCLEQLHAGPDLHFRFCMRGQTWIYAAITI